MQKDVTKVLIPHISSVGKTRQTVRKLSPNPMSIFVVSTMLEVSLETKA
jgi:hypothetical protein